MKQIILAMDGGKTCSWWLFIQVTSANDNNASITPTPQQFHCFNYMSSAGSGFPSHSINVMYLYMKNGTTENKEPFSPKVHILNLHVPEGSASMLSCPLVLANGRKHRLVTRCKWWQTGSVGKEFRDDSAGVIVINFFCPGETLALVETDH